MESLTPVVSVLLPIRQWRSTTLEAVQSVLSQTLHNVELVIIGQDDVGQLLDRLPQDSRIVGVARQGVGIVAALNTGLACARAPYIARMDDDDIAYPHRLETQLNYLKSHLDIQLCAARVRFIDEQGSVDGVQAGNNRYAQWLNELTCNEDIVDACYTECPMPHPTLMAHKDIWQSLGGYRDIDGPEDYDLILRAMLAGMSMGKPDALLQDWREHPGRLTYSDQRYRREAFTRCRAWAAVQPSSHLNLHTGRSVWICGTGKSARQWHDALLEYNVSVKGFVDVKPANKERSKRGKPIISYEMLITERSDSLVITALSEPRARNALLAFFKEQHWRARHEYILGG